MPDGLEIERTCIGRLLKTAILHFPSTLPHFQAHLEATSCGGQRVYNFPLATTPRRREGGGLFPSIRITHLCSKFTDIYSCIVAKVLVSRAVSMRDDCIAYSLLVMGCIWSIDPFVIYTYFNCLIK